MSKVSFFVSLSPIRRILLWAKFRRSSVWRDSRPCAQENHLKVIFLNSMRVVGM
jgi:hypothetical protein